MEIKPVGILLKRAFNKYIQDDPIQMSGTTAFFAVLALAPMVIISSILAGILISESTIQETIMSETQAMIGEEGKEYIEMLIENYRNRDRSGSTGSTIVAIAIFLGILTTFFSVVQNAINFIWRVRSKPENNFLKALKDRLLSFALLLVILVIIAVSILAEAALTFGIKILVESFPNVAWATIQGLHVIVSIGMFWLIFAIIYRFLPDARIKWKVTWTGAFITSLLFILGRFLIGVLLRNSGIGDLYGAAGSIIIVLLWVFYSSIIFYFGAEITQQFAAQYVRRIQPKDYAVKLEIKELNR